MKKFIFDDKNAYIGGVSYWCFPKYIFHRPSTINFEESYFVYTNSKYLNVQTLF